MCPRSKRKHYVEDLVKHCYAIYVCVCVRVWMYVNVRCVLFVNNKKKEKKKQNVNWAQREKSRRIMKIWNIILTPAITVNSKK